MAKWIVKIEYGEANLQIKEIEARKYPKKSITEQYLSLIALQ